MFYFTINKTPAHNDNCFQFSLTPAVHTGILFNAEYIVIIIIAVDQKP